EKFSVSAPGTIIRTGGVRVGTSGSETNNVFRGIIDEILVYSRALNASEILRLHPNRPPPDGSVLSYEMETLLPDGSMEDLSGHRNHATVLGTMDVAGKVGRAREFDGNNDAIQSPSVPRLANGTFALWVRLASLQAPPPVGEYPNLIGWSQDP